MTPGKVNFLCPQGSTFRKRLTYKIDETPVDLTGYSSRLQVRQNYYSTDKILDITSSSSAIIMGASAGTIDILVDDAITTAFPYGDWVYDLEIESGNGTVDRLIEGNFIVTPEVTR
jgi:hypothetical protein